MGVWVADEQGRVEVEWVLSVSGDARERVREVALALTGTPHTQVERSGPRFGVVFTSQQDADGQHVGFSEGAAAFHRQLVRDGCRDVTDQYRDDRDGPRFLSG